MDYSLMNKVPIGFPAGIAQDVVFFGPKANCTLDICPVELTVYGYLPDLAANISFVVLYVLSAAIHTYLGCRWKSWFFMACMVVGALNAIIGYSARIILRHSPFNFAAFMTQIVCVTGGPVFYSAAIYVTISIAIKHISPALSRFNPSLFYWIFIPADIICLIFQAVGGAVSTESRGTNKTGVNLSLAGLSLQVFVTALFCGFFADYTIRYLRSDVYQSNHDWNLRLKLFFWSTGLAIILILIRCSYRLAELHEGYRGKLIRNEPLFMGLEGVMVLLSGYCLMIGHPGFVFKKEATNQDEQSSTVSKWQVVRKIRSLV